MLYSTNITNIQSFAFFKIPYEQEMVCKNGAKIWPMEAADDAIKPQNLTFFTNCKIKTCLELQIDVIELNW